MTLEDLVGCRGRPRCRDPSRIYFTTPLYYVNAEPHLGHTYTTVVADTLARFCRAARPRRVLRSPAPTSTATRSRRPPPRPASSPKAYADRVSGLFRTTWDAIGIATTTSSAPPTPYHVAFVQEVLARGPRAGDIYFGSYGGLYCIGCERFYPERELVDGKCPDHRTPPVEIAEENYFFRMEQVPGAAAARTRDAIPT